MGLVMGAEPSREHRIFLRQACQDGSSSAGVLFEVVGFAGESAEMVRSNRARNHHVTLLVLRFLPTLRNLANQGLRRLD
jgi:hypothetical protein